MHAQRSTESARPKGEPAVERPLASATRASTIAVHSTLPIFLQRAAADRAVSAPSDPAEHEARSIAARVTREFPGTERSTNTGGANPEGLPAGVRMPMEAAFGADFSNVRMHADTQAAENSRALGARAFTVGNEIAFRPGEYQPHDGRGRELIAHELTHVVQQRGGATTGTGPASSHSLPVQRDVDTAAARSTSISDDAADQAQWRGRVDRAVRAMFGLRGAAVTAGQVAFVDQAEFGRRFPTGEMEEILLNLFLAHGEDHRTKFYHILDHNRHPFCIAGVTSMRAITELRTFVHDGISAGIFEGQTREHDVTTGDRFPVFRSTPGELIAEHISGVTDIASDRRSGRSITMQIGAYVDTLAHEICHFYISNAFRNMVQARTDGGEYLRGARISQILFEGFAEYFAQQVMDANVATFGPSIGVSYPEEVRVAGDLVITLGESAVRQAYFGGDATQVARVNAAVDAYKDTHEDLLLPDFMIPARPPPAPPTGRP